MLFCFVIFRTWRVWKLCAARTQPEISPGLWCLVARVLQSILWYVNSKFCNSLENAVFITFLTYYCFNLEYPVSERNTLYFIQDYILDHPDSLKNQLCIVAVASDIKRNLWCHVQTDFCACCQLFMYVPTLLCQMISNSFVFFTFT